MNNDVEFSRFLNRLDLKRYKIKFSRVEDKPHIYVKTVGLKDLGLKEVFTISKSPYINDAEILIKTIVNGILNTNQSEGIRKDIFNRKHPLLGEPIKCLIKSSVEYPSTVIVISPDENNKVPGEKGYIQHY
jgi:hypothetical protein